MIILPAIDIKDGNCVRLLRGDYATAHKVAEDPLKTAEKFENSGARWIHLVDLDGAKARKPINYNIVLRILEHTNLKVEIGGGIRDMATIEFYLNKGVSRIILGSAALNDPNFVREAVKRYDKKIAVGIDALDGKVAAEGWTQTSTVDYLDFAKEMEQTGVKHLIVTDISKDGTLEGPNLAMLDKINRAVSCNVIASGGVSSIVDIINLYNLDLYGAIAGKSLYTGDLDLQQAVELSQKISGGVKDRYEDEVERYFTKSELLPTIIQENSTGEVLMMAYMNPTSLRKTFETGYTWFYSRSRRELWNKGATSGNVQKVVSIHADCDDDTLLIKVDQTGPACHTGKKSCFYKELVNND